MASLLLRLILVRRIRMPQLKSQWTPLKTLKVLLAIKVGLFLWIWPTHQTQIEKKNPCNMTLIQFFITDPLQTGLQCTEVRDHSYVMSAYFWIFLDPPSINGTDRQYISLVLLTKWMQGLLVSQLDFYSQFESGESVKFIKKSDSRLRCLHALCSWPQVLAGMCPPVHHWGFWFPRQHHYLHCLKRTGM